MSAHAADGSFARDTWFETVELARQAAARDCGATECVEVPADVTDFRS